MILKTFSSQEFVIQNDEAQNIVKVKNSGSKALIGLRCGAYVDSSAIESITGIPLVKVKHGQFIVKRDSNDNEFYINEYGNRTEVADQNNITYLADPKYSHETKFLLEEKPKPKELSNEDRVYEVRNEGSSEFAKKLTQ